jgi:hypothetical protein
MFGIRNLRKPRELSQPNQLDMVGERGFEPPTPGPELRPTSPPVTPAAASVARAAGFLSPPFYELRLLTWPELTALRLPRDISAFCATHHGKAIVHDHVAIDFHPSLQLQPVDLPAEMPSIQTIESPTAITHDRPVLPVFSSV